MATALALIEEERLSEKVKLYPCLYDKTTKGYKEKDVVQNAWKEVADTLDFVEDGKRAQAYFATLKKKYLRKKRELKDANKSGTSTKAYERAERGYKQYQFLSWLDKFVQPRDGRNNLPPSSLGENEDSKEIPEEEEKEDEEIHSLIDSEDDTIETVGGDVDDEMTQIQTQSLPKKGSDLPPKKRKLQGAAKENLIEEMEFSLMKKMSDRYEKSEQRRNADRKIQPDSEELFAQAVALDLKQLPPYERCIAKGEIRNVVMKHQMAVMERQMCSFSSQQNESYQQGMLPATFSSPPQTPNPWMNSTNR